MRRGLLTAVALAFAIRLALFLVAVRHAGRFLTKDSFEYDALARHFGAAYVRDHAGRLFDLGLSRPPGYPAFLRTVYAVTGGTVWHAILVEVVLSTALVAAVYAFARPLVGEAAALAAAFVLAVDPVTVAMSSNLTTECLFAALWLVGAWLWSRRVYWAAGLVLGLSVLVRPIGLYLPLLLVPLTVALAGGARARRLAVGAALLVAFVVPVGLWAERNHHETGVVLVSTIESHNLLDYRAADALAIDTGTSRPQAARELEAQIPEERNPARRSVRERSLALRTLAHHPQGAAISFAEGLGRVVLGPGRAELERLLGGGGIGLELVEGAILFAELALALAGTVVLVRGRLWRPLAATLTFVLYDIVLAAGPEGNARLRMPAMPFLAVLAGVGAISAARRLRGVGASLPDAPAAP